LRFRKLFKGRSGLNSEAQTCGLRCSSDRNQTNSNLFFRGLKDGSGAELKTQRNQENDSLHGTTVGAIS
jgi:hypothetical protein